MGNQKEVPQSPEIETLGTEHEGAPTQVEDVKSEEQPVKLGKNQVKLTVIADPKVNYEVKPHVTKYKLSQQNVEYFNIDGKEVPTIQSRTLWLKVVGDNPLDKEKDDTLILSKINTRLTKSTWLSDPDDPDSEVYFTHWINPRSFTMPENHVPAEW